MHLNGEEPIFRVIRQQFQPRYVTHEGEVIAYFEEGAKILIDFPHLLLDVRFYEFPTNPLYWEDIRRLLLTPYEKAVKELLSTDLEFELNQIQPAGGRLMANYANPNAYIQPGLGIAELHFHVLQFNI